MLTAKRGEPLPINGALNKPRTKFGLKLNNWMAIVFVSATIFLVGLRLVAMLTFAILSGAAWFIVRKHPKMFQIWFLRWQQKAYYDPRKH